MIVDGEDLVRTLKLVYAGRRPPRPLDLVLAVERIRSGEPLAALQKECATTKARLEALLAQQDPATAALGAALPPLSPEWDRKVRRNLGQLVLGKLAERAFEEIYRNAMNTAEFRLENDTQNRTDTDYRVVNGAGRRVFRVNIKFFGSSFLRARELVKLDPEDCFALATYKIHRALKKQEDEHLPYIFVIVGVPGLSGAQVGASLPENLVHLTALAFQIKKITGRRSIEDAVVDCLTAKPHESADAALEEHYRRIRTAPWYILSARRAEELLRKKMFERCYALVVPRFARSYPNAEVDMHFSLREDLHRLEDLFDVLRQEGLQGLVSRLERGTY